MYGRHFPCVILCGIQNTLSMALSGSSSNDGQRNDSDGLNNIFKSGWICSHTSCINKILIMQKKQTILIISGAKYNEHTSDFKILHDFYGVTKYKFNLQKGTLPTYQTNNI